jgi:hypothetical protein
MFIWTQVSKIEFEKNIVPTDAFNYFKGVSRNTVRH